MSNHRLGIVLAVKLTRYATTPQLGSHFPVDWTYLNMLIHLYPVADFEILQKYI